MVKSHDIPELIFLSLSKILVERFYVNSDQGNIMIIIIYEELSPNRLKFLR